MDDTMVQPNAQPISDALIEALLQSVLGETVPDQELEVVFRPEHSNDVAELRLADGRTLMAKRGRFDWSVDRFRTSRRASRLLHEQSGIVVPRPLALPPAVERYEERPVEAYWRIDMPTLQELWPDLDAEQRRDALRSLGALLARVHDVRLGGHGPLLKAETSGDSFIDFLASDLGDRLLPAVAGEWAAALPYLERLIEALPTVSRGVERRARFAHGDLHMGNVLCRWEDGEVESVGLLDLETAAAGPAEFDLAVLTVHHGPLFAQPVEGDWFEEVLRGYGARPDPARMAFFRAYHLLNMGFYSAMIGHHEHAQEVVQEIHRVLSSEQQVSSGSHVPVARA